MSIVAKRCESCGKEPSFGNTVARLGKNAMHRRIKGKTSRMFSPNIQTVRTVVNGRSFRMRMCTSCIKAGRADRTS
jgi:large subunit ribosomal protein L28